MTVSIILALYNGEKFLAEQIQSILDQTEDDFELIVVDDGSTDNSPKIASSFQKKDSRVKLFLNEKNLGISKNFLRGASLSSGGFICYSDQDDVWRRDKIAVLKGLLERDPKNMLAYSDLEVCDEGLHRTHASFWRAAGIRPKRGHVQERAFLRNIAPGCSMMFRQKVKTVIDSCGPDMPFLHDHLAYVIAAALGNVVYTRERLVRYRQHTQNNIGAFYPSVHENDRFIQNVRTKAAYALRLDTMPKDRIWKLDRFCDSFIEKSFWRRMPYMPYYLDLRRDTFKDKTLGVLECLMPDMYCWLRAKAK